MAKIEIKSGELWIKSGEFKLWGIDLEEPFDVRVYGDDGSIYVGKCYVNYNGLIGTGALVVSNG